ncbi:MAG: hypothetical protein A3J94_09580 [Syntrophus sp. RIFOXYC2_FULL_54_9]|nr:MAG: hypothetical protein A3J94_09580 [Syntrophus sp. RIFOXYC2_FULL_54_9]
MKTADVTCIECESYKCRYPKVKKSPSQACPRKQYPDVMKQTLKENRDDAAVQQINAACMEVLRRGRHESLGYEWTRVRELIEYARILRYKRIGIAGCVGLIEESKILGRILEESGFTVILVNCMAGGALPEKFGLKTSGETASSVFCNPFMQAEVLNREKTELNVMVGLCVGHDILFIRHSQADVTPLIVKDRVTGHNPVAALYTSQPYYKPKLWNPASPAPASPVRERKKRAVSGMPRQKKAR